MRRTKRQHHSTISLERLGLSALRRIKQRIDGYLVASTDYEQQKAAYDEKIVAYRLIHEEELERLEAQASPILATLGALMRQLSQYRVGMIKAFLYSSDDILEWRGNRYDKRATTEISQYEALGKHVAPLLHRISEVRQMIGVPKVVDRPKKPSARFKIRDQLKTFTFDVQLFDKTQLDQAIALREQEETREKQSTEKLKAKAMAYDEKQRVQARSIRNKIKHQLQRFPKCPYCNKPLLVEDAHADHIYPLTHGGLSTAANMVFVCAACNQAKRDRTLREFIELRTLEEGRIHTVLQLLGKRF